MGILRSIQKFCVRWWTKTEGAEKTLVFFLLYLSSVGLVGYFLGAHALLAYFLWSVGLAIAGGLMSFVILYILGNIYQFREHQDKEQEKVMSRLRNSSEYVNCDDLIAEIRRRKKPRIL